MRYTRYDYKKNKGDNFILWLIGIIAFSVCIGMLFYNLFLKEKNVVDTTNKNESVESEDNISNENKEFGIIQCGVFKDRKNAEATLSTIDSESTCFIVEEDGSFKLMYGIYTFDKAGEKSNSLTGSSVNNFRLKCVLGDQNEEKKAESEIIDAYIKIVNKLTEKDVRSVDTKEFKSWVNNISGEIKNSSNEFNGLVDHINKLPDEYKKDNQKESLIEIYKILKNYKQK